MKEPVWLSQDAVIAIQLRLLAQFGGLPGLRDEGLLASALNRPMQACAYATPDIFDLAADYAAGIIKNHPFLDGNKRAGFMAAYTFLGINGYELEADETDVLIKTLALAAGELSADGYAEWLRGACPRRRRKRS